MRLSVLPAEAGGRRYPPVGPRSVPDPRKPGFLCGTVGTDGGTSTLQSDLLLVRILLVDEQEVVRRGVAKVLEGQPEIRVVGEAGSVGEALRRAPAVRPDVAVVPMRFIDGSGADICGRLKALVPGVRCLVLSESVTEYAVHAAMRAGASGYVGKDVPGPVLLAAVRKVASGETTFDREAAAPSGQRADGEGDRLAPLTNQERTVLRLIAEGLSNREIGERMRLNPKTVKNYVSKLLAKLGLANRTHAAVLATELRVGPRDREPAA
jgi:two-component system, NarL family, response regulator DevR